MAFNTIGGKYRAVAGLIGGVRDGSSTIEVFSDEPIQRDFDSMYEDCEGNMWAMFDSVSQYEAAMRALSLFGEDDDDDEDYEGDDLCGCSEEDFLSNGEKETT